MNNYSKQPLKRHSIEDEVIRKVYETVINDPKWKKFELVDTAVNLCTLDAYFVVKFEDGSFGYCYEPIWISESEGIVNVLATFSTPLQAHQAMMIDTINLMNLDLRNDEVKRLARKGKRWKEGQLEKIYPHYRHSEFNRNSYEAYVMSAYITDFTFEKQGSPRSPLLKAKRQCQREGRLVEVYLRTEERCLDSISSIKIDRFEGLNATGKEPDQARAPVAADPALQDSLLDHMKHPECDQNGQ